MTEKIYTVSEVNTYIKGLLADDDNLYNIQIVGEISNFKRYPSGHCYFTLKDADTQLKCVMFKWQAMSLKFNPTNGETVLAIGKINVYERDGVYQLYTDLLLPQGAGNLQLQYEKLKAKLQTEGLFEADRKRELPVNPLRVGIVTSPAGAAVRDIITVSRRRHPGIKLLLYPVQVQGDSASREIARAIAFFNQHRLADVLIVGRGGGSMEDLWAFNEEVTVRAIAASKIPTISAVGHETDFTLCDFAADARAATPSQAAEMAVADIMSYKRQVQHLLDRSSMLLTQRVQHAEQRLEHMSPERIATLLAQRIERVEQHLEHMSPKHMTALLAQRIERAEQRLERATHSWAMTQPLRMIETRQQRLDMATEALQNKMNKKLQQGQTSLAMQVAKLESLSPLAVLSRGYSMTQNEDGHVIMSVDDVSWGQEITTTTRDGKIISLVQNVERQ